MAKELKTGWEKVATSGSVVYGKDDGRIIQKEWITDIVENFNLNVFTPQIWPEHDRWFHPVGKILAVKSGEATEPDLAGEIHLYAILAPSDGLIEANKRGHYTFPSIEVGENYLGKGKYFLQGIGVTDDPASAGISQLKFSRSENVEKSFSFPGVQFNTSKSVVESKTFFEKLLPSKKDINQSNEVDEIMNEKQFSTFNDGIEKNFAALETVMEGLQSTLTSINESIASGQEDFKKQFDGLSSKDDDSTDDDSNGVTSEHFSKLNEDIKEANKQIEEFKTKFAALENEETEGSGDDGDDGTGGVNEAFVL